MDRGRGARGCPVFTPYLVRHEICVIEESDSTPASHGTGLTHEAIRDAYSPITLDSIILSHFEKILY
jgi:hypothetical protein